MWKPFPANTFPKSIRDLVTVGALAQQCDESFIALPTLTVLSSAIGASRCVELHRGWCEPAILWCAIIGESGTLKTPSIRLSIKPLREIQEKALAEHAKLMCEHEVVLARWEREHAAWNRRKSTDVPSAKPIPPLQSRVLVSDITVEGIAPILRDNPRGVLLCRDELAGWIAGFDKYSAGRGSDVAQWLSMHSGESLLVDRKVSGTIHVPRAHVCVVGGIQPDSLRRSLGTEHIQNGLAARLLLAMPPRKMRRWLNAGLPPEIETAFSLVVEGLRELQADSVGGNPVPVILRLDQNAEALWGDYFARHAREQFEMTGPLASAWSKLEGGAARLALVIHLARWAAGEQVSATHIDAHSMLAGITLADWFKGEVRRVYEVLMEHTDQARVRKLREWIARRGGSVTMRDTLRGLRVYRNNASAARADFDALEAEECGRWTHPSPGQQGGAPLALFTLIEGGDVDETPHGAGLSGGSVAVTTVSTSNEWEVVE